MNQQPVLQICFTDYVSPSDYQKYTPRRGDAMAAGLDVCSTLECTISAQSWFIIPTGLRIQFTEPHEHYIRIAPRSGLAAKNGVQVGAGVIDASYRGEVKVVLFNHSTAPLHIHAGDRIAQLIMEKISYPTIEIVSQLTNTDRGNSGFGSTDNGTANYPVGSLGVWGDMMLSR